MGITSPDIDTVVLRVGGAGQRLTDRRARRHGTAAYKAFVGATTTLFDKASTVNNVNQSGWSVRLKQNNPD